MNCQMISVVQWKVGSQSRCLFLQEAFLLPRQSQGNFEFPQLFELPNSSFDHFGWQTCLPPGLSVLQGRAKAVVVTIVSPVSPCTRLGVQNAFSGWMDRMSEFIVTKREVNQDGDRTQLPGAQRGGREAQSERWRLEDWRGASRRKHGLEERDSQRGVASQEETWGLSGD